MGSAWSSFLEAFENFTDFVDLLPFNIGPIISTGITLVLILGLITIVFKIMGIIK